MKIGFLATPNHFTGQLLDGLKSKLEDHHPGRVATRKRGARERFGGVAGAGARHPGFATGLAEAVAGANPERWLRVGRHGGRDRVGDLVSNSPADITGNADSVAEFAVLLLLGAARRLGVALAALRDDRKEKQVSSPSLMRKTVCIVGPGAIGSKIAQRLLPFGVRLTAVDRNPLHAPKEMQTRPLEELKEAVAEADFVMFCVRATKENTHMIDASVLAAMKKGAVLVNIARGTLIDEQALYRAVTSGHLSGAALDVLEHEPMRSDDPLLTLPQILVTPHIAGITDLMLEGTVDYSVEVIEKVKSGEGFASLRNRPKTPRLSLET